MRRKQWGVILALLGLMAILLAATGYVCLLRSVPLRISKETTYITEPLKSNGKEVDYFVAWEQASYPEDMATEDNGYRLIVQHLGNSADRTPECFRQVCEKLDLNAATIKPDMTLEDPDDILCSYADSGERDEELIAKLWNERRSEDAVPIDVEGASELDEYDLREMLRSRISKPWTLDDLPMLEPWLQDTGPTLDLLDEVVRKPTFHIPMARETESIGLWDVGPELGESLALARTLKARANHRIALGDIDGAIDDIIVCKRLGWHVESEGSLVSLLLGDMIEGIADANGIAGALEHPPTLEQLRRLVANQRARPPMIGFEASLLLDRYQMLSLVQSVACGTAPMRDLTFFVDIPTRLGYDWNVIARRMNEQYDALEATGKFLSPSTNPLTMVFVRSRSELLTDKFGESILPSYVSTRSSIHRRTCSDRMKRIVLAMLLYEREHGVLPPAHTVDGDSSPLHSWRVLLLPYLDEKKLYDKIRPEEPWDSPHNSQFHDETVEYYQCPVAELPPGRTTFAVVVGPDLLFEGADPKTLSSFGPKSANMVLVVERKQDVCWMNPTCDMLQVHAEEGVNSQYGSGAGIDSHHEFGANVGLRSGAVRFMSGTVDVDLFGELLRGESDAAL
jgi:uncharacterized protein DUF1559